MKKKYYCLTSEYGQPVVFEIGEFTDHDTAYSVALEDHFQDVAPGSDGPTVLSREEVIKLHAQLSILLYPGEFQYKPVNQ